MSVLHVLFAPVRLEAVSLVEPGVALITGKPPALTMDIEKFTYSADRVYDVYNDIKHLLSPADNNNVVQTQHLVVAPMHPEFLQSLIYLGNKDDGLMLRLILAYCLTVSPCECTSLLSSLLVASADLFDTMLRYRFEPWTTKKYADLFGISLQKLNILFQDKYGLSAKRWLMQQRLEHADYLLKTTSKKILDVALESGFKNAAHFSESFRRYFHQTPMQARHSKIQLRLSAR